MAKVPLSTRAFAYPNPVVLVGAEVEGKPNYLAIGWVAQVCDSPPLIAVGLSTGHYTNQGIRAHGEFSINLPSAEMAAVTDYCGIVSGEKTDKSGLFETFAGSLAHAPMIAECPLTAECRLYQTVELPGVELFIGEVAGVFADDSVITNGKLDPEKFSTFIITVPELHYRKPGESLGRAWQIGKDRP